MATRKGWAVIALLTILLTSGGWATECAPDPGTPNAPAPEAPHKSKGQHLAIEVDWPEGRKSPVTIAYTVPTNVTGGACPTGTRLVHRVDPPFVCDWDGYTGGAVSVTALQNEHGLMTCGIYLGAWHREVDRRSTTKIGELLTCRLRDVGPVA
jgi:hypothetical protein